MRGGFRAGACAVAFALAVAALAAPPAIGAEEEADPSRPPIVDPRADRLLRAMGDVLAAASQFSFRARIEYDQVLPSGQKVELGALQDVAVRRPDRVYVEYEGDAGANRLWYDGRQITVLDGEENLYAAAPMPGKIDQAIDRLIGQYGFSAPLSDFLYSDPYRVLRARAQFGLYLGETSVEGVRCHHLAFVDKAIDWQIWIQDGTQLVPCKVVITYSRLPGEPRFAATFSDWDLGARLADVRFEPMLPPDAARIDFVAAMKKAEAR
ncbi:MAG: DUF2092 domain-containing protein [Deltaproteobacteria bacterium]|nr:DUF2092 domain-containing protein [Deltaproteobacteria bacterium]